MFRFCDHFTFKFFARQIWIHPVPSILDAATNMLNAKNLGLALMLHVNVRPIIRLLEEFAKQVRHVWNTFFLLIIHIQWRESFKCFSSVYIEIMFPLQEQLHTHLKTRYILTSFSKCKVMFIVCPSFVP